MDSFLDRLGLKRRQAPRIAVQRLVDVQVAGTDYFVGFYTQDMSLSGICMQGQTPAVVERVRAQTRRVPMRVRLPRPYGVVEFEADLKWEREEGDQILTGWVFTRIRRDARRVIHDYIEAHPEDLLKGPAEE